MRTPSRSEPRALVSSASSASSASSDRYEAHTGVAVLCSELAHEISPTLAFLRDLVRSRVLAPLDQSIAEEETTRLETVVASLRRTKRREDATATVNLAFVASRAAARAREEHEEAGGSNRVAVDVPEHLCVQASERGLELMLLSLLRNALHAAGGAPVALRARNRDGAWSVAVENQGEAIPEALAERIFTPLATLGASGRGTGIPIVLRIARDHGWDIAHTREDGRTTVTITFAPGDTSAENHS